MPDGDATDPATHDDSEYLKLCHHHNSQLTCQCKEQLMFAMPFLHMFSNDSLFRDWFFVFLPSLNHQTTKR